MEIRKCALIFKSSHGIVSFNIYAVVCVVFVVGWCRFITHFVNGIGKGIDFGIAKGTHNQRVSVQTTPLQIHQNNSCNIRIKNALRCEAINSEFATEKLSILCLCIKQKCSIAETTHFQNNMDHSLTRSFAFLCIASIYTRCESLFTRCLLKDDFEFCARNKCV